MYEKCLEELKKVQLCYSAKGIRQKAYSNERSDTENEKYKLKNITMYDMIFNFICNPKYKIDCDKRAKNLQQYQIEHLGKDYTYKLKDGVIGVWSFRDYRYKSSECFESYNKWLGSILFDGDFDIKSIYSREEANELSKEIIKRLYPKLCKYEWFAYIDLSTSGKGIHIYTSSIPFSVELIKKDNYWVYDNTYTTQDIINRKKNQFKANFHHKLKYILDELEPIWNELGVKQDITAFFDDATYKPEQPMNLTPLHEGNALINPNFKCTEFIEVYDEVYNGIKFESIDERVVATLGITEKIEENEAEKIKRLRTDIKIENKVYNIPEGNGFYFGHSQTHDQQINGETVTVPSIDSTIFTLLQFYNEDEVIDIWNTPGFYTNGDGLTAEQAHIIDWIKSYKVTDESGRVIPKEEWIPNNNVVRFLNKYCGFDIKYKTYTREEKFENCTVYNLKENEYLADYWDNILKEINNENGIYLIISPTGSGKTKTHIDINDKTQENLLNNIVFQGIVNKPILCTEPYNSILNSKFKKSNTQIITGSKHFDKGVKNGTLYVTNYIHFEKDLNVEDFSLFNYLIIDESHLITKEEFRSEQLVSFIHKLKEASEHCIVILQTATPMDEYKIFNINKIFKLNKKDKRHIIYNYLEYKGEDKFSLDCIYSLVRKNIENGIKTYVYQSNISLDKAKAFANLFSDIDVCVYHKRLKMTGEDKKYGMKYLEEKHRLDNYDLLISSVYFGVGNDIDDELEEACTVIIGNKTWQEDIQVFGRWRNAKKINVYEIVGDNVPEGNIKDNLVDYNKLLEYKIKNITYNYGDITNRRNSIVVRDKIYQITDKKDIPFWACISICEEYHSNKLQKDNNLTKYVDVYNSNLEELEYSTETVEETKKFFKSLNNSRLTLKKEIINKIRNDKINDVDYSHIPKLDNWIRIVKRLYYYIGKEEFDSICNNICGYKIMHSLDVFNDILHNYIENSLDYAEIAAFEYHRTNDDLQNAFLLWYFCQDINEADYVIKGNWYFKFKWKARCYADIPIELINILFSDVKRNIIANKIKAIEQTGEFLDIDMSAEIAEIKKNNILEYDSTGKIKKFKQTKKSVDEMIKWIEEIEQDKIHNDKKEAGLKGKGIIIDEKIKESRIDLLDKYNLQIGQVFLSCKELATYCGININTVTKWQKKEWIKEALS